MDTASRTEPLTAPRRSRTTAVVLAGPALFLSYGLVRLVDGLDGSHGPGPAWTIGHLLFLVGLVLFGAAFDVLRRKAPPTRGHRVSGALAEAAGLLGLLAMVRVIVIDIASGLGAADRTEMNELSDRYGTVPIAVPDVVQDLGPLFFLAGVLILVVQLAISQPRMLPLWTPVAVVAGFAFIAANLDLLPIGAVLLGLALAPLRSESPGGTPAPAPAPAPKDQRHTRPGRA